MPHLSSITTPGPGASWGLCLVAWSVGCTCPTGQDGPTTNPLQDEGLAQAAFATTAANKSTLVVSGMSNVVAVHPDLEPGTYKLTDLPPNAAVSRMVAKNDQLVIETIQGVSAGHTLWKTWDEPVGTVEVGVPPVPLPMDAVEWMVVPGFSDRILGGRRQQPILQDNLNANSTLDLFLRVTDNGVPIATGYSTDVQFIRSDPPQSDLPAARAEISGWRESPTLVEVQYVNTTTQPETVSLDINGFRGTKWTGWGTRFAEEPFEVAPGDTVRVVDALDPAFHDGFLSITRRVQRGDRQGGSGEVRVRHAVPAGGERGIFAQTSADIPPTFERVRWDPGARRLHLDWNGVQCKTVGYVLLRTHWSVRQAETSRSIEWTVWSPASDWVQLPPLPPDEDHEVSAAMVDPSFSLFISVEASRRGILCAGGGPRRAHDPSGRGRLFV